MITGVLPSAILSLNDVFLVPELKFNLLSIGTLAFKGFVMKFTRSRLFDHERRRVDLPNPDGSNYQVIQNPCYVAFESSVNRGCGLFFGNLAYSRRTPWDSTPV